MPFQEREVEKPLLLCVAVPGHTITGISIHPIHIGVVGELLHTRVVHISDYEIIIIANTVPIMDCCTTTEGQQNLVQLNREDSIQAGHIARFLY